MDAFAECAAVVRAADRDRYLADLFAPEATRKHLFALHAFGAEVEAIRDKVSEPRLGEIRLQWWREALFAGGSGNPVADAAAETIRTFDLPFAAFDNLLTARVFDLYHDLFPALADLEGYAGETASAMFQLSSLVLAGGHDPGTAQAAGHAGVAAVLFKLLRTFGRDTAQRRCLVPKDSLETHELTADQVLERRPTPELFRLLADLRTTIRDHLAKARAALKGRDPAVLPAYLPLVLVEPALRKMERPGFDPFRDTADLSAWRRQWLLWRAARSGKV